MIGRSLLCKAAPPLRRLPIATQRWHSTSWLERRLSGSVQSYISTSDDPYLNLSIEHHILQKSSPDSVVLLLYVNRPSIIIGRNQNPWLEVNLSLLDPRNSTGPISNVDLVRRRSGGGTVFHDQGNVNWTVICPSTIFTRDKHAEMVVRALRACGIERARVNERHDIVLDQGQRGVKSDPDDTHTTPYTDINVRPLKVSGSAYKLTRGRALHHGTCLLSSPNLSLIPQYLHSPAKPHIVARGVESISSPVSNVHLGNEEFTTAVQSQFGRMYQDDGIEEVDDSMLDVDDVKTGYDELQSLEWKYLSTPQFTASNQADTSRPLDIELTVRHGVITSARIGSPATTSSPALDNALLDKQLHQIQSWNDVLPSQLGSSTDSGGSREYTVQWLDQMLPSVHQAR